LQNEREVILKMTEKGRRQMEGGRYKRFFGGLKFLCLDRMSGRSMRIKQKDSEEGLHG